MYESGQDESMSQGMISQGMAVSHHLFNLQAEFGHPAANYPAHYGARVDAHPQQHRLMAVWHQHLVCLCHNGLGKAKDLVGMPRASVAHLSVIEHGRVYVCECKYVLCVYV